MRHPITRLHSPLIRLVLVALLVLGSVAIARGAVFVSVTVAPPPLPVYVQPICPGPGFIWIPGYWAWGPDGYYWVPGYWAVAPYVGALWTPGYWAWFGSAYVWHAGYWGPRVGFYGGINYGFGYFGVGYAGGYWRNGVFNYNTAVTNINVTNIHNTYNQPVVANTNVSRVSYNGGAGGIAAQPTTAERRAERDQHRAATPTQVQHERLARADRGQLASVNHGTPGVTATPGAGAFKERGPGPAASSAAGAPGHVERGAAPRSGAPQGPGAYSGPPQAHREAKVEHGVPPPPGGAPRPPQASREARIERSGPPPGAGAPQAQGPAGPPPGEPRGVHQGGGRQGGAQPSPERHEDGRGGR